MTFEIHSDITNRSMTIAARAMQQVLRAKTQHPLGRFRLERLFHNALLLTHSTESLLRSMPVR